MPEFPRYCRVFNHQGRLGFVNIDDIDAFYDLASERPRLVRLPKLGRFYAGAVCRTRSGDWLLYCSTRHGTHRLTDEQEEVCTQITPIEAAGWLNRDGQELPEELDRVMADYRIGSGNWFDTGEPKGASGGSRKPPSKPDESVIGHSASEPGFLVISPQTNEFCMKLNGSNFKLNERNSIFLKCIIESSPRPISFHEMQEKYVELAGCNPSRILKSLPEPVRDHIQGEAGKGYCWRVSQA
jgi:hypothetical protein